jgi:SH3-like domain-containing protein
MTALGKGFGMAAIKVVFCSILVVLGALSGAAWAKEPAHHFSSLDADKVYLRQGPTFKHRILWVYRRKGLPVEVISEYGPWRRVRTRDGTVGWIHQTMLSNRRTAIVTGKTNAALRRDADATSRVIALLQPGVVLRLDHCQLSECEGDIKGLTGWIAKARIWGVGAGETF